VAGLRGLAARRFRVAPCRCSLLACGALLWVRHHACAGCTLTSRGGAAAVPSGPLLLLGRAFTTSLREIRSNLRATDRPCWKNGGWSSPRPRGPVGHGRLAHRPWGLGWGPLPWVVARSGPWRRRTPIGAVGPCSRPDGLAPPHLSTVLRAEKPWSNERVNRPWSSTLGGPASTTGPGTPSALPACVRTVPASPMAGGSRGPGRLRTGRVGSAVQVRPARWTIRLQANVAIIILTPLHPRFFCLAEGQSHASRGCSSTVRYGSGGASSSARPGAREMGQADTAPSRHQAVLGRWPRFLLNGRPCFVLVRA